MNVKLEGNRIIDNQIYNAYLNKQISTHKETKIAPSTLFNLYSDELILTNQTKQEQLVNKLRQVVGEPYFNEPGFISYCMDSMEFLTLIKDRNIEFNLTLTSPPYNIGKEYEDIMPVNDFVQWCSRWMTHIYEVTSPTGAFWLNLGYLEVEEKGLCIPLPYLLWDKSPFYLLQEVVWKYGAGVSTKKRLSPRNEKWLYYVKNNSDYVFNLDEIRDPNVKYPNQKKNGKYRCNPLGKNPSDVWEYPKVTTGKNRSSKERTEHPAQFPLGIVERVIKVSSNYGDIVLDPFAGSFSSGIAAFALGRIFIGIEIRPDYCEIAKDRYLKFVKEREDYFSQISLF